jgi:histone deacetylase 1/2
LSTHVSTSPLELIHTDVWGPATVSVGGFKYYVSFIDDFSKFTWIYLLHAKSDVESIFYKFQKRVELLLDRKIKCVQSDWGGEYRRLHKFFENNGIATIYPVLTLTNKMVQLNGNIDILWKRAYLFLLKLCM